MFFIRADNAAAIASAAVAAGIILIREKQWKSLLANICGGLAGLAVIAVPVFLWFIVQNSLGQMIYSVFTYNIEYKMFPWEGENISLLSYIRNHYFKFYILFGFVLAADALRLKSFHRSVFFLLIGLLSCLLLINGRDFPHYFAMILPQIVLISMELFHIVAKTGFSKSKRILAGIVLTGLLLPSIIVAWRFQSIRIQENHYVYPEAVAAVECVFEKIPENEYGRIWSFNTWEYDWFYVDKQIIPDLPWFGCLQGTHFNMNPAMIPMVCEQLTEKNPARPLWIITVTDSIPDEVRRTFEDYYEEIPLPETAKPLHLYHAKMRNALPEKEAHK